MCTAAARELICDHADVTFICVSLFVFTHVPCRAVCSKRGSRETATVFLNTPSDSSDITYFFITEIAAMGFSCGSNCSDLLLTWLIFSSRYHVCLKCLLFITFMNHAEDLLFFSTITVTI